MAPGKSPSAWSSRILWAVCLWTFPAWLHAANRIPDYFCQDCHADKLLVKTNLDRQIVSMYVDAEMLRASGHATNLCVDCHGDLKDTHPHDRIPAQRVDCGFCHLPQGLTFTNSVHGQARAKGKLDAAWCTSCHGTHDILAPQFPASKVHSFRLLDTCGFCHGGISKEVSTSSHGEALTKGQLGAPTCITCHRAHQIESLNHADPLKIAHQTCGTCHDSKAIATKFKMPGDRLTTYLESYHGLLARGGMPDSAHCADCHGAHRILPGNDPRSTVHASRLIDTCGQCHTNATVNFTLGTIHQAPDDPSIGGRLNRWVKRFYLALMAGLMGGILLHHGWHLFTRKTTKRSPALTGEGQFARTLQVQHLFLTMSFVLLAWSGFALKFSGSWLHWTLGGDEEIRRWLHRGAGLALVATAVWHLLYLVGTRTGRRFLCEMAPAKAGWRNLRRAFGRHPIRSEPLVSDQPRFDYAEKFDYWAAAWGSGIMIVTGLLVWFKLWSTQFLPRWAVEVALTVHYFEAILACLVIAAWHLYRLIVQPPSNADPRSEILSASQIKKAHAVAQR